MHTKVVKTTGKFIAVVASKTIQKGQVCASCGLLSQHDGGVLTIS